jgi:hypothetical protein
MAVDANALKKKILEFYPELGRYAVETTVAFNDEKNAWVVTVSKGDDQLSTYVDPEEAEACLGGTECVHLGNEIGQFVRVYCEGKGQCET